MVGSSDHTAGLQRVVDRLRSLLSAIAVTPARFAGVYLLVSVLFLTIYDILLPARLSAELLAEFRILREIIVISGTAGLIYVLTRESQRQLREANTELGRRSDIISVLLRVLRHNLRNDMAVIRGRSTNLAQQFEEPPEDCPIIVDTVDELLDLSEKARTLEEIITADHETVTVDVRALLSETADQVQTEYPAASITVEDSQPITIAAQSTLGIAFRELIENAAKHAGSAPTVTISVERTHGGDRGLDGVTVHVTDDGPGLPDAEQAVLREGVEKPLVHGNGLGLYQVYLIVDSHGGQIETSTDELGTTVSVTLGVEPQTTGETMSLDGELGQPRDRFRAVFEEAADGMVILDEGARILDANASTAELLGVAQDDLIGRSMTEFVADRGDSEFELVDAGQETIPLAQQHGPKQVVEYSLTTEIMPSQHLAVLRTTGEQPERRSAPRQD